jgi:ornithine cyclodeaminase/alanine dehydrogenase-like protein (mu-crystallin family)
MTDQPATRPPLLFLNAAAIEAMTSPALLVEAVRDAALAMAGGGTVTPERGHMTVDGVTCLTMPSASAGAFGMKMVSVAPGNAGSPLPVTQGLMILMDGRTGTPLALLDGAALTGQRTAAVAALAIRHLVAPGISSFGVVGAGVQAAWQAIYTAAETGAGIALVFARSDRSFLRFRDTVTRFRPNLVIERCTDPADLVRRTDLIIAATTSSTPVLPDSDMRGKTLVSVGSFRRHMQELPDSAYRLAGAIVVDSPAAIHEVGDVINPVAAGLVPAGRVTNLADLVSGVVAPANGTRIFKSVGHAIFDLFAARHFHRLAVERGLGQELHE